MVLQCLSPSLVEGQPTNQQNQDPDETARAVPSRHGLHRKIHADSVAMLPHSLNQK